MSEIPQRADEGMVNVRRVQVSAWLGILESPDIHSAEDHSIPRDPVGTYQTSPIARCIVGDKASSGVVVQRRRDIGKLGFPPPQRRVAEGSSPGAEAQFVLCIATQPPLAPLDRSKQNSRETVLSNLIFPDVDNGHSFRTCRLRPTRYPRVPVDDT